MSVCSQYGTFGSETGALLYERLWKSDGSRRGVIYCHGHGGFAWDLVSYPDPLLTALVQSGFPVIVMDLGGTATWGNSSAQSAMTNAFTQLKGKLGAKNAPPLIVAYSMGNLSAYLWAASNPVAAIVGEAPAIDLADIHDNNRGGYATDIETAYGGLSGYNSAIGTHNPATQTANFTSIPSRLYYSTLDGSLGDGIITQTAVTTFQSNIGAACTSVNLGSVTHPNVPSAVPVNDALAFLESYA